MDFDVKFFVFWASVTAIFSIFAIWITNKLETLHQQAIDSGDLVIIKANPKEAWPIWLLSTILLAPLLTFVMWIKTVKSTGCSRLFEINIDYLTLVMGIFVMPIIFTAVIFHSWITAKKALKNGYMPSLDSVCMFKTEALSLKLKRVKFRVFLMLYLLPLYVVFFYALSFWLYTKLEFDRDYSIVEKDFEKKCQVIVHYPHPESIRL